MSRLAIRAFVAWSVVLVLAACSEDDPVAPPSNRAPEAVVLSAPTDGQTGLDGDVTLTWQAVADPDGDPVSFSVFLDESLDPSTQIASGLSVTEHIVSSGLEIETTYYWKVVASDGKGGESESSVQSFVTRVNNPPGAFSLQGIANGATGVGPSPTLQWTAATDPDGDLVRYDLYFDTASNPNTVIAADLDVTSFTVTAELDVEQQYSWRVVARDALGAETVSETRRFTTRALVVASEVTSDAAFAARSGHSSVVFDGKMWVIGGSNCCGGRFADAWWSTGGQTWTAATESAAFPARTVHSSVVFDGKMWVMGGNSSYTSGNEFSDVWSSVDGVTWVLERADAEFGPRFGQRSVVFDGKIWIYGGVDAPRSYSRSEIWQSDDGVAWTRVKEDAGFGGTSNFQITEFQGALWKTGGQDDRVFRSVNGVDWTVVQETAGYGDRQQHQTLVFDAKLWLISGSNAGGSSELPDVWSSADGIDWQRAAQDAGYTPVAAHTALAYDGKMWVIAGGGGNGSSAVFNSVFSLGY